VGTTVVAAAPRLLRDLDGRETWDEYRAVAGADPLRGDELVAALEAADLRGRGGAGFPAARKWRAVAAAPGPRAVVANGEEGEPFSYKDRYLLRRRPHAVLDGALLAAEAVDADRVIVYLADEACDVAVREAIAERPDATGIEVFRVDHEYVAGEESAVVRAIDGGPALPTEKPPRPFERGVGGRPTLVANVETLAQAAWIARWPRSPEPPRLLATIGGACSAPGLYELRLGERLGAALERAGADPAGSRGVVMGGYFAGVVNARAWDLPLDYERLREEGTGIGCAAFLVLGPDHCAVAAAACALRHFAGASSRQCGTCTKGTEAMASAVERLAAGAPAADDIEKLERWSSSLRGRGACALLDGAAHMAGAFLREFPEDVGPHARGERCPRCATGEHEALFAPITDVPPVHAAP
jgi:NADH:ubiquinone oxidoreductase subunit F (NADH-binding)